MLSFSFGLRTINGEVTFFYLHIYIHGELNRKSRYVCIPHEKLSRKC